MEKLLFISGLLLYVGAVSNAESYCPKGYVDAQDINGNKCFKVVTASTNAERVTRNQAKGICENQPGSNATLASIHSDLETAVIVSEIRGQSYALWIGLSRATSSETVWYWNDGSPNDYDNWKYTPSTGGYKNCADLDPSKGDWTMEDCTTSNPHGYICQVDKDASNLPPAPSTECTGDYIAYDADCYRFVRDAVNFSGAVRNSLLEDLSLTAIHNHAENSFVRSLLLKEDTDNTTEPYAWIGLWDKQGDGEYVWDDESYIQYVHWKQSGSNMDYQCVAMGKDGYWISRNCTENLPYVARQYAGSPPTAPPEVAGACPDINYDKWRPYGSYCYYIGSEAKLTWLAAREVCLSLGATMVHIHNKATNDFIFQSAQDSRVHGSFWLGFHRSKSDDGFEWDDYSSVQYTNWMLGHPMASNSGNDCARMSVAYGGDTGEWTSATCSSDNYYMCRKLKAPPTTEPPHVEGHCPDEDWVSWGHQCYLFKSDTALTWHEAEEYCQVQGGDYSHVTSIHTLQENRHIEAFVYESSILPMHRTFWLGSIQDNTANKMTWVDSSDLNFHNWKQLEPNLHNNCTVLHSETGKWAVIPCASLRGFVCKVHKGAPMVKPGSSHENGSSSLHTAAVVLAIFAGLALGAALIAVFYLIQAKKKKATSIAGTVTYVKNTPDGAVSESDAGATEYAYE